MAEARRTVTGRRRLDAELVRRGLAASRELARTMVAEGRVRVAGAPAAKSSRLVTAGEALDVAGPPPLFVSRGGDKLDAALERFAVDVSGRHALDAGHPRGASRTACCSGGRRASRLSTWATASSTSA